MKSTEEVIKRISLYRTLTRFGYLEYEKLSRLKILKNYYTSLNTGPLVDKVISEIQCAEQLAKGKKLTMPLKVRGVFLREGRPNKKYYYKEELKKSLLNPLNKKFPMMLDHRDKEASTIVGVVSKIEYDETINGLKWWGHINDITFARNVMDGVISQVSATVYSVADYDETYGLLGKDLTFKELSLVISGAVDGNYIEAY